MTNHKQFTDKTSFLKIITTKVFYFEYLNHKLQVTESNVNHFEKPTLVFYIVTFVRIPFA